MTTPPKSASAPAPGASAATRAARQRARLVEQAAKLLGSMPTEHELRCVPIHRRRRFADEAELVEWRATFRVGEREWTAAGASRDEAVAALERALGVPGR